MSKINKRLIAITGKSIFSPQIKEMVESIGHIPVFIDQKPEDVKDIFQHCSGLVLAGGSDISPSSLSTELADVEFQDEVREVLRNNGYSKFDKERDLREIELIKLAKEQKKPILGICRGHQLLLAQAGFYLMSDISAYPVMHSPNGEGIEMQGEPMHYLRPVGNGDKFFKKDLVNSFHHQAIYYDENVFEQALELGIEILGVSNLSYEDRKQSAQQIVELARGEGFISTQFHCEADYGKNHLSQLIVGEFQKMIK